MFVLCVIERLQKSLDEGVRKSEKEKDAFEKAFRRRPGGARDQPVLELISGFQKQVGHLEEETNNSQAQLGEMARRLESCTNKILQHQTTFFLLL